MQRITEQDELTDAVLLASRVLVSVAARSLSEVSDEVTLAQYRAMVILASRGPQLLGELATALDVNPSTATRLCDRMTRKGLVTRNPSAHSRREVLIELTDAGRSIVDRVTRKRRQEVARIAAAIPKRQQAQVVDALQAFGAAAGEVPEQAWTLGWTP